MSFFEQLLSRGDLDSQLELISTPTSAAPLPPPSSHSQLQSNFETAMLDATIDKGLEITTVIDEPLLIDHDDHSHDISQITKGRGSLNAYQQRISPISKHLSPLHPLPPSTTTSPSFALPALPARIASLGSLLSSPSLAAQPSSGVASPILMSSPTMARIMSRTNSPHHGALASPHHPASLHLAFPSPSPPPLTLQHAHTPPTVSSLDALASPASVTVTHTGNVAHRRTPSRERIAAATSLVPRHDYIPAHSLRGARMPASSPPPMARSSSLDSLPGPQTPVDPATIQPELLRSNSLIPIIPPTSFVPPSPAPLVSPYKSILRTSGKFVNSNGVIQSPPPSTTPSSHPSNSSSTDSAISNSTLNAEDVLKAAMQADAIMSHSPPTDTDDESSPSPSPEGLTPAFTVEEVAPATNKATFTRRASLRPNVTRVARDAEERKTSIAPSPKHRGRSASVDTTTISTPVIVKAILKPTRHFSHDLTGKIERIDEDGEEQEHKSAVNPKPQLFTSTDDALQTPARKGRHSVFTPHSAPPKSSSSSSATTPHPTHGSSHKPRVRFDRAEIHEFDLIPDATKVPGEGDFAIGMDRTPHTSWVASLDAYETLRAKQRKADGPEPIDEAERKRIWCAAQEEAEKLNELQKRKSGIKRLHPKQERHLDELPSKHKKRRLSNGHAAHDDSESEQEDEEEEEEDEEVDENDVTMEVESYPIAPLLAPPSPSSTVPILVTPGTSISSTSTTTSANGASITFSSASFSFSPHLRPQPSPTNSPANSRPPSPSSACFRFVPVAEMEKANSAGETNMDTSDAPAPSVPILQRSHSAPTPSTPGLNASPPPTKLLFSDHADLELIRASRKASGCNCRGSKSIKVCGALEDMKTDAMLREAKRSTKKGATAGLRGTAKTNGKAANGHAHSSLNATPIGTVDPYEIDLNAISSEAMEVCPCYAAGVGCNSNICRCFSYCCVNKEERYVFNQSKVNSVRRKILKNLKQS